MRRDERPSTLLLIPLLGGSSTYALAQDGGGVPENASPPALRQWLQRDADGHGWLRGDRGHQRDRGSIQNRDNP